MYAVLHKNNLKIQIFFSSQCQHYKQNQLQVLLLKTQITTI